MAPLCTMGKKLSPNENKPSEKADFSSIINFLGADLRKDKKRRRGDAEKKRRDRINKCLDQLEELIPYVRQKKLCSKVDKAEVLELTVHFVKETLFEKELTFRKTQLSSVVEYERMKWLGQESSSLSGSDYDKTSPRSVTSPRSLSSPRSLTSPTTPVGRKHVKCNCGCSDGLEKRPPHPSPDHTLPGSFSSFPIPPPPPLTSSLHRKEY